MKQTKAEKRMIDKVSFRNCNCPYCHRHVPIKVTTESGHLIISTEKIFDNIIGEM